MSSAADPQHEKFLEEIQRIVDYIEGVYRTVLNRPPELAEG